MSATKVAMIWLSLFLVGFIGQLATGIPVMGEKGIVMMPPTTFALVVSAMGLSGLGATIVSVMLGCTQPLMRAVARMFK